MLDGLFNCVGGRGINPARLSVSVLVVVDNPDFFICQDDFESFKEKLTSWTNASWVRIWKQEINGGASSARNIGLRQSAGDYVLFLDDDVMPQPHLLEAYAGLLS